MTVTRNTTLQETQSNEALTNSVDLFTSFFLRKSINTVATCLTEDILKKQHYNPVQIERIKNMVYLTLLTMQGSLYTSGSALGITELFKYCGYANDEAYWIGFAAGIAINLSLDPSPWGITKTFISTIGGVGGKWCTQWAYKKLQNFQNELTARGETNKIEKTGNTL